MHADEYTHAYLNVKGGFLGGHKNYKWNYQNFGFKSSKFYDWCFLKKFSTITDHTTTISRQILVSNWLVAAGLTLYIVLFTWRLLKKVVQRNQLMGAFFKSFFFQKKHRKINEIANILALEVSSFMKSIFYTKFLNKSYVLWRPLMMLD